jgi:hypothetical protein
MSQNVELSSLDTRYEGCRLRDDAREARLLASLAVRGVEQPLAGVDTPAGRLLLNGEQARFVVELLTLHGMTLSQVAELLSRSKAWVSTRRGLMDEMGETIERILFQGAFPVYCYLYTLRPFRRMKSVTRQQLERFVQCVAGQRLSVREIEFLAHAYFRGSAALVQAIEEGKLGWALEQMHSVPPDAEGCNEFERVLLHDLHSLRKLQDRVLLKCQSSNQFTSRAFYAQAHLLSSGLLGRCETFTQAMREFHDRCGRG